MSIYADEYEIKQHESGCFHLLRWRWAAPWTGQVELSCRASGSREACEAARRLMCQ